MSLIQSCFCSRIPCQVPRCFSIYNNGLNRQYIIHCLGKLKRTTSFAESLRVTTGGGKDIYKSHPFSRVTLYRSYCGIVLSLKSAEKRTCDNMLPVLSEVYSEELPAYDGLVSKKIQRRRLPWSDYKLRRWQTSRSFFRILQCERIQCVHILPYLSKFTRRSFYYQFYLSHINLVINLISKTGDYFTLYE